LWPNLDNACQKDYPEHCSQSGGFDTFDVQSVDQATLDDMERNWPSYTSGAQPNFELLQIYIYIFEFDLSSWEVLASSTSEILHDSTLARVKLRHYPCGKRCSCASKPWGCRALQKEGRIVWVHLAHRLGNVFYSFMHSLIAQG
jgi:hypothetical protein